MLIVAVKMLICKSSKMLILKVVVKMLIVKVAVKM